MEKVSTELVKYPQSFIFSWEIIPPEAGNAKGFTKAGYLLSVIDLIATQSIFQLLRGKGQYMYVTRSVDELNFYEKLKVGEVVLVESQVCGTWNSSLELQVDLFKIGKGQTKSLCCQCFLTFVLVSGPVDDYDRVRLPPTLPGSPQLELLFKQRTARRQEIIDSEKNNKQCNEIFRNYLMSDPNASNNPTYVQMSKIVLPVHANGSFNTFGGQILHWMETCAALCGGKFADSFLLTANMKHTQFFKASKLGDCLIFRAIVTRVFNTSLEVYVTVEAIYRDDQKTRLVNDGFFTFVCVDNNGKPQKIDKSIQPRNMAEQTLFDLALKRRANRLKNPQSPTLFELKGSKL